MTTEPTTTSPGGDRLADGGTRVRYDLMDLAARIDDVIALGRGDPDLPTPAHIVEAAKAAIDRGDADRVSDPAGTPELRAAVADKLRRENGVDVGGPDGVVVTTGGQEGLFLAVQALLAPGDEILVPDPRYTSYDIAIKMAGASMVSVPTCEADGFDLDPGEVEKRITPRTKALLLISPNNPTAGTVTPQNLRALADIAVRHDLYVISDEIYEKLVYDPHEHLSIGSLPGMAERTVTVNGFSKTFCMTGWRLGYLGGPHAIMAEARRKKAIVSTCAPVVSQAAGVAALTGPMDVIEEYRQIYTRRRKIVLDTLDRLGISYGEPRGGFYVFLNAASTGIAAPELSLKLLDEAHVLIFPGTGFGEAWADYMRLAWLVPEPELTVAMQRVEAVLAA
jgi:aminotransferase